MTRRLLIFLIIGWTGAAMVACTGPASRKASSQPGVTEGEITDCDTRSCFVGLLDYGGEILLSRQQPDGSLEEIYQVRRARVPPYDLSLTARCRLPPWGSGISSVIR
jgi:hypothetical protein